MQKANEFEHGISSGGSVRTRFSPQSNTQYTFESTDELLNNLDELSSILKHHSEHQVPRLDVLDDYYKGNNVDILQPNRRKEKDKADHRATHNFAKYVANFMQGFFVGVPVAVSHADEDTEEKVQEINETLEDDALNANIVLDLSIYGRAYELLHRNQQDEIKSYLSSPLETILIYDNTVEQNVIAGVRYFTVGYEDQTVKVLIYTDTKMYTYYTTNLGDYTLQYDGETDHPFGEVPINEYQNNRFRQGDYENVLDLIDLYDAAQSDTANFLTDTNDAYLAIKGNVELTTDEVNDMKQSNVLLLKPGQDVNGKESSVSADYIYKQYDVQGTESYKSRIQADIHKFTGVPDLSDMQFSGQQTGEAMKYKLFFTEQVRIAKERMFKKGLERRYRLINNIMSTAKEAERNAFSGLMFQFTPNFPKNTKEQVDIFNSLGGELSNETTLEQLPFEVDIQEEQKRVDQEREVRRQASSYMDVES